MAEHQATVTAELRDKIKSKMDVAKFFAGSISLLMGILLRGGSLTSFWSKAGIVVLFSSLGFCIAAMFIYDHLLWPKKYWTDSTDKEISEDCFQKRLRTEMLSTWWWLFVPAVVCFGIGFLLVLVQELSLPHLRASLGVVGDLFLVVLLVAAVVLPIWFGIAKWPRIHD